MSGINVTITSTSPGVSIGGGTAVSVAVSGPSSPVSVSLLAGGSTSLPDITQLEAGTGITISTAANQFTISSYSTAQLASFAGVQSVNGKTGTVTLQAVDLTAAAAVHTHSTADIVGLTAGLAANHTHDASAISAGTISVARLPLATTSSAGAIQVGSGLSISSGVLSATGGGGSSSASFVSVPATFTATGTSGTFAADATYLYACYSANSWLRVQRAAWYAVPTVPQDLTLTAERGGTAADTVIASWKAPANNGGQLSGYRLQLNTAAQFTVSAGTLTYQWNETAANTNACTLYTVSVKAYNSEGDSPAATESRYSPNTTYPTDLVVAQTPNEGAPGVTYDASWLPACYGGYNQYQLQVRLYDAGNGAEDNWSTVGSPIVNSYTHYIADATSNTHYQWRVRANTVVNGNITASSVWSQIDSTP